MEVGLVVYKWEENGLICGAKWDVSAGLLGQLWVGFSVCLGELFWDDSSFMEGRRSGNYEQSIWDDDYVQSISTPYVGKEYLELAENLKEKMRIIISEMEDQPDQLGLIDNLQRLDVSYHFQDEIKKILDHIHLITNKDYDNQNEKDMYSTALKFRILRQNGYQVPQGTVFLLLLKLLQQLLFFC
ncbi:Monoterpene synthase [Forsythia ovata]|uniref:Monoterpene synthase n=1 Tax=Forsythia ovata TaxID=205694 RepID=A0ABD1S3M2_9LAMI